MPRSDRLVAAEDPWSGYAITAVEIVRPGAVDVVVTAAPSGEVGRWPWETEDVIYVLTAWDPGEERLSGQLNRARQVELEEVLRAHARGQWRARGYDPISGHRDEGVAVSGVLESDVLEAGARFGQEAVFVWTADEWAIVACSGGRRLSLGWRVTLAEHDR